MNIFQSRVDVIEKFQEFVSVLWGDTKSLKNVILFFYKLFAEKREN